MADMTFVRVQQILMVVLNFFGITGNGFILYLILTNKSLRQNKNLYLMTALATVNLIFAVAVYPYVIFLLAGWSMKVDYPALPILILVMPAVMAVRFCQIFDIAIAVDRLTAIQWPSAYKLRNRVRYTLFALLVGFCFASIDVVFIWTTTNIQPHPGCPGAGCFMSVSFVNYSGYSDMCIGTVGLITTTIVLLRILTLKKNIIANGGQNESLKRANRTAVGVLICSSITLLLPGVLQGVAGIFGISAIQKFGPSVVFGLVLNIAVNPFIYGLRHHDIRQAFREFRSRNKIFGAISLRPNGDPTLTM